jgi:BirA family biotin operon repressor/biotin-[acetyl-CoA-carboxylase] ligase
MKIEKYKIFFFSELDSTNDCAKRYLEKNKNQCDIVFFADFQTKGRGAFENTWLSNRSENLTFSIVVCPNVRAVDQFIISELTSLAIYEYLKNYKINAKIKWPNDILVENEKICGILIENTILSDLISASVIGIGLNINQTEFPRELRATSMKKLTKRHFDIKTELENFLIIFDKYFSYIAYFSRQEIDKMYFFGLLGTDEYLKYKSGQEIFEAKIKNIDQYGRLVLIDKKSKERIFGFKEVELLK